MTFPTTNSEIYYNDEGEVLGWDRPSDPTDYYCDTCGFPHIGDCIDDQGDEDEDDEGYEDAVENRSCTCGHPDCGAC